MIFALLLIKHCQKAKLSKEFSKNLNLLLQKKGWWGEQIVVDSAGVAEKVQLGSMYHRLKTIYRVNMQTSYMSAKQICHANR